MGSSLCFVPRAELRSWKRAEEREHRTFNTEHRSGAKLQSVTFDSSEEFAGGGFAGRDAGGDVEGVGAGDGEDDVTDSGGAGGNGEGDPGAGGECVAVLKGKAGGAAGGGGQHLEGQDQCAVVFSWLGQLAEGIDIRAGGSEQESSVCIHRWMRFKDEGYAATIALAVSLHGLIAA